MYSFSGRNIYTAAATVSNRIKKNGGDDEFCLFPTKQQDRKLKFVLRMLY